MPAARSTTVTVGALLHRGSRRSRPARSERAAWSAASRSASHSTLNDSTGLLPMPPIVCRASASAAAESVPGGQPRAGLARAGLQACAQRRDRRAPSATRRPTPPRLPAAPAGRRPHRPGRGSRRCACRPLESRAPAPRRPPCRNPHRRWASPAGRCGRRTRPRGAGSTEPGSTIRVSSPASRISPRTRACRRRMHVQAADARQPPRPIAQPCQRAQQHLVTLARDDRRHAQQLDAAAAIGPLRQRRRLGAGLDHGARFRGHAERRAARARSARS